MGREDMNRKAYIEDRCGLNEDKSVEPDGGRVSSDGGTPPSVLSGIQLSTLPASQGPSSRLYGLAPMRFAVSPYPRERHRPTDHPSTPRLCRF